MRQNAFCRFFVDKSARSSRECAIGVLSVWNGQQPITIQVLNKQLSTYILYYSSNKYHRVKAGFYRHTNISIGRVPVTWKKKRKYLEQLWFIHFTINNLPRVKFGSNGHQRKRCKTNAAKKSQWMPYKIWANHTISKHLS